MTERSAIVLAGDPVHDLAEYQSRGGGRAIARAREIRSDAVIDLVAASGLRGRGGAGFPTGRKWAGIRDAGPGTRFAVCNAAEGEPGTFKDRALLRHNPFQVVEGLAIVAFAVGAHTAYIATKATYAREAALIEDAVHAASGAGWFGDAEVRIVLGPDEYLFGEEKALLEVIEGRDPLPRLLPPFQHGLFATDIQTGWEAVDAPRGGRGMANPTLINNVETLANVPHIVVQGAEWFRARGTASSPGTIVATVTGDVREACVAEVELGTPLSELVAMGGGASPGHEIQLIVNGVANAVLTPASMDTPLDYEAMAAAGSGLGSAGFVVYDDTACPVEVALAISRFLYVESCGQCRSCKFGCGEITRALDTLATGGGSQRDIELIGARLRSVTDQTRCYLATEEQVVIASLLERFPNEFALHIERRCSKAEPRTVSIPKIVDIADGRVTWDEKHASKQPDWTYAIAK